jgi:hypothetical protein
MWPLGWHIGIDEALAAHEGIPPVANLTLGLGHGERNVDRKADRDRGFDACH